ncbi:MAG: type II toxin-antitoxin system VapC family toxin [Nocardioidaceae bacterium]
MIVFWDTSAFLPLVLSEAGSATAVRLWEEADRVVASRLLYVEAAAALAMAQRMGRIEKSAQRAARRDIDRLHEAVDCVEVTPSLVRRAAGLAEELQLRGYDAVHCASAEAVGDEDVVVASGDREVLRACQHLGLGVAQV